MTPEQVQQRLHQALPRGTYTAIYLGNHHWRQEYPGISRTIRHGVLMDVSTRDPQTHRGPPVRVGAHGPGVNVFLAQVWSPPARALASALEVKGCTRPGG